MLWLQFEFAVYIGFTISGKLRPVLETCVRAVPEITGVVIIVVRVNQNAGYWASITIERCHLRVEIARKIQKQMKLLPRETPLAATI